MKNDNDLLADMPVSTAFFKLAIPAIAAQLINILYNLVETHSGCWETSWL